MVRILIIFFVVLLVLLLSGGILLYLGYGLTERPPSLERVAGMSDTARVELFDDGSARIRAETKEDALAALGFLHAQEHGWTMSLYSRSARGRLSEWFGDDMLDLDRLVLRLGIARGAREAFASLDEQHRALLQAYSRGVNAAFGRRSARMRHEFVALEVEPDQWEPWHSLAVERLLAWMAAVRPSTDTLTAAGGDLADFFDADDLMRRWLHLHGFENGLAWTVRDSSGVRLFQRHVYGASALPLFQTVSLETSGDRPVIGATIVGSPFMPGGRSGSRSWAVLLSSSLTLQRARRDTTQVTPVYERLISADGEEHLIRVDRTETEMFFASPRAFFADTVSPHPRSDTLTAASPFPIDSVSAGDGQQGWVLRWSGFVQGSDAATWLDMTNGVEPSFNLFDGVGLELGVDGSTRVLGDPLVARSSDAGSLASNSSWAVYVADRFDSLLAGGTEAMLMADLEDDRRSAWAAHLAPSLVESAIAVPNQPAIVTETLAFLRNWDFAYDRASIAASIFDTWMTVYTDSLAHQPKPAAPDSAHIETLLHYELLVEAVERLAAEYGENLSQWRWEVIQPKQFYFPVFSADTLVSADISLLPKTRYAPIEIPGSGHPTTLFWGPSSIEAGLRSPARWEASISTADWEAFRVRSRSFGANRFFGRYVVSDRPVVTSPVGAPDLLNHTILLLPR